MKTIDEGRLAATKARDRAMGDAPPPVSGVALGMCERCGDSPATMPSRWMCDDCAAYAGEIVADHKALLRWTERYG